MRWFFSLWGLALLTIDRKKLEFDYVESTLIGLFMLNEGIMVITSTCRTLILNRNEKLCSGRFVQGIHRYHRSLKLRVQTSNCFMDKSIQKCIHPNIRSAQFQGRISFLFWKKSSFLSIKPCQLSLQRDCSIVVKDCRRIDTFWKYLSCQ